MKHARQKGNKSNINYNRIYVNGEPYTVETQNLNKYEKHCIVPKDPTLEIKLRGWKYTEKSSKRRIKKGR